MARRVLSRRLARGIALTALALCGCRRGDQHATPQASASASASANAYAEGARESHFQTELTRARARWRGKPTLGDCSVALHDKEDLDLCHAASSALAVLAREPDAQVESALPALENGALSLARLSKRLRYLSLSELSKKRMTGDAGAPVPPAASSARDVFRGPAKRQQERGPRGTFEISDGPLSQLLAESVRSERDVVRNLGAYLEYAELPVRRTAFVAVKRLHDQHPQWALLTQLVREAALLEPDSELKGQLAALSASAQPSSPHPAQSADSK
ncbi:MAG: hypothetical protein ABIQ16_12555 [Polyangiaceae bacterium]